jgi:two-component system LytT family sensor kinase
MLFWLTCSVQGTMLEYSWIQYVFNKEKQNYIILLAICFNMALLPAKMMFTYFALNVAVSQPLKRTFRATSVLIKLAIAFILAIILYRIVCVYFINPLEYPQNKYTFKDVFDIGWGFVALLDIGYVAGIAAALKLFRMQIHTLRNEKSLVKDKLETELKFLKNQINPHFLFNTLNNIYGLARKKSDKTPEVVVKLSKLLRFMLYESAKDAIPIRDEINILEDYVQLEKIRHGNRFDVCFQKEIDDYNQLIAPLILLPFIENAFKHGINEVIDDTSIEVKVELKEGQLTFFVRNSHDRDDSKPINESIGLSNVRRQLELMYNEFSLTTQNLARSFVVDLEINLKGNGNI